LTFVPTQTLCRLCPLHCHSSSEIESRFLSSFRRLSSDEVNYSFGGQAPSLLFPLGIYRLVPRCFPWHRSYVALPQVFCFGLSGSLQRLVFGASRFGSTQSTSGCVKTRTRGALSRNSRETVKCNGVPPSGSNTCQKPSIRLNGNWMR